MRLPDIAFKILERQDIVDFAAVTADRRAERAGAARGYDLGRLFEAAEELAESAVPAVVKREAGARDREYTPATIKILFIPTSDTLSD